MRIFDYFNELLIRIGNKLTICFLSDDAVASAGGTKRKRKPTTTTRVGSRTKRTRCRIGIFFLRLGLGSVRSAGDRTAVGLAYRLLDRVKSSASGHVPFLSFGMEKYCNSSSRCDSRSGLSLIFHSENHLGPIVVNDIRFKRRTRRQSSSPYWRGSSGHALKIFFRRC